MITDSGWIEWVQEASSLTDQERQDAVASLVLDSEDLGEACVQYAGQVAYWTNLLGEAQADVAALALSRRRVEASLYLDLKGQVIEDSHGRPKPMTEKQCEAHVEASSVVAQAQVAEVQATDRVRTLSAILAGVKVRKSMIEKLAELSRVGSSDLTIRQA